MAGIKRLLPFPPPLLVAIPPCDEPLSPSFYPARRDVLAAVALTWISYPVAFDNGALATSSMLQRNRDRALKNEVTCVARPR